MIPSITPIYAALFALLYIFLSLRVAAMRRATRVSLGDGGNAELMRRTRVHGNFIEYVPLTLILLQLAELQGQPTWTLHLIGGSLAIGRLAHAYAISLEPQILKLRVLGMILTVTALTAGALANLTAALAG